MRLPWLKFLSAAIAVSLSADPLIAQVTGDAAGQSGALAPSDATASLTGSYRMNRNYAASQHEMALQRAREIKQLKEQIASQPYYPPSYPQASTTGPASLTSGSSLSDVIRVRVQEPEPSLDDPAEGPTAESSPFRTREEIAAAEQAGLQAMQRATYAPPAPERQGFFSRRTRGDQTNPYGNDSPSPRGTGSSSPPPNSRGADAPVPEFATGDEASAETDRVSPPPAPPAEDGGSRRGGLFSRLLGNGTESPPSPPSPRADAPPSPPPADPSGDEPEMWSPQTDASGLDLPSSDPPPIFRPESDAATGAMAFIQGSDVYATTGEGRVPLRPGTAVTVVTRGTDRSLILLPDGRRAMVPNSVLQQ